MLRDSTPRYVGLSVNRLVGWSVGRLVGRLVGRSVGLFIEIQSIEATGLKLGG